MITRAADVLVVDDDDAIRESICEILEDEGLRAEGAPHGEAAANMLRAGMRPRLILLDLMMPVMDGWQFMGLLRAQAEWSHIPVVVVSAALEAPPYGACTCLGKPVDVSQLIDVVAPLCAHHWPQKSSAEALTTLGRGCGLHS